MMMQSESTHGAGGSKFRRPIRLAGYSLLACLSVGGAVGLTTAFAEEITIIADEPTKDERFVLDSLKSNISSDRLWLDCSRDLPGEEGGYVSSLGRIWTAPVIHLDTDVCQRIISYAVLEDKGNMVALDHAQAVQAAVHETVHIADPSAIEAAVECLALQKAGAYAENLGASPAAADQLNRLNLFEYHQKSPRYRTVDCFDGGPYDIDPANPGIFPYSSQGEPLIS